MRPGIQMVVITTVVRKGICIGEVMTTGTILTDLTWAGLITIEGNIANGTGIIITMADAAGNKTKPFKMKRFSDAERTRSSSAFTIHPFRRRAFFLHIAKDLQHALCSLLFCIKPINQLSIFVIADQDM